MAIIRVNLVSQTKCLIFLEYYAYVYNTITATGLGQLYCYLLYIDFFLEIMPNTYAYSFVERKTVINIENQDIIIVIFEPCSQI